MLKEEAYQASSLVDLFAYRCDGITSSKCREVSDYKTLQLYIVVRPRQRRYCRKDSIIVVFRWSRRISGATLTP